MPPYLPPPPGLLLLLPFVNVTSGEAVAAMSAVPPSPPLLALRLIGSIAFLRVGVAAFWLRLDGDNLAEPDDDMADPLPKSTAAAAVVAEEAEAAEEEETTAER